jgi:co-chaperonin GroES (HSP10)
MSRDLPKYRLDVEPFHDYILVRTLDNPNRMTSSGIIIPDAHDQAPVAQVLAIGPGRDGVPAADPTGKLAVGDLVLMAKSIGTKVEYNGVVAMMVKWYDLQGKFRFYDRETGEEYVPEINEDMFQRPEPEVESRVVTLR